MVSDKVAKGRKVTFVDVGGSLTLKDLTTDGIHPTAKGYDKMGAVWYEAVVERDTLMNVENIIGTALDDTLVGNAGVNIIEGGAGNDLLTGGGNADIFVYRAPTESGDTITDFLTTSFKSLLAALVAA